MVLRWLVVALAAVDGKKRERHGADVASWVRDRTHHLNASEEAGDESRFAGTYECPDTGEAYSAAFLCTRAVFLKSEVAEKRLFEGAANMEGASNAMFRKNRLLKTVDMFDFFIEHLSWYERRFKADADSLRARTLRRLREWTYHDSAAVNPSGRARDDVVVIMPYYATAGGDSGHSALESRRAYLKLTLESLKPTFPKYTVCVATEPDHAYVTDAANGLGFYDVLKRFDITKPSRLGFATLYTAQQALQHDPRWAGFKFVFYTESDQILHVRDVNQLLHIAGNGAVPNHVLPHRVMPAPRRRDMGPEPLDWTGHPGADSLNAESGDAPKKPGKAKARRGFRHAPGAMALAEFALNDAKALHRVVDVTKASCCFDRAPCAKHRSHWKNGRDRAVELFQIADPASSPSDEAPGDSFALIAGEGNFLRQHFRVCAVNADARDFCHDQKAPRRC
ncbi:hypothetical protein AURANDRAFT_63486 [Aureococcus anophagefferens]|uniref:Uncharacterized protein n=1 Tax=Aureococcus anophagefferens TaxID=44056 RepID=F0Y791_AURAN|nr:hypothetical protein AURANDRAFT_63486 [Aureococcus anophagefferens]EGB09249.1 hypothetical protein AURANDRAFT_63486 [Aureococcus anophagefferens]|eukprot:XP_009036353.1 hypothetical protein AURANDRAFT_63486 [Aureococcus anophagefferens]